MCLRRGIEGVEGQQGSLVTVTSQLDFDEDISVQSFKEETIVMLRFLIM